MSSYLSFCVNTDYLTCLLLSARLLFDIENIAYELPYALPSDLRNKDLRKSENIQKMSKLMEIMPSVESSFLIKLL